MSAKISVMISEEEVAKRLVEMGEQISRDYAGKELLVVGTLRGAVYFMTELTKRIDEGIPVTIDFVSASSYGNGTTSSGDVRILKDVEESMEGKHVLVVEDIVDTGQTLSRLLGYFETRNPASLKLCALLDKPSRRLVEVPVDYVGFQIEDKFVVGYGMDYAQIYRNLPYIGVVENI